MKLCRFSHNGTINIGKIVGDQVIDLSAYAPAGASMRAFLAALP